MEIDDIDGQDYYIGTIKGRTISLAKQIISEALAPSCSVRPLKKSAGDICKQ